MRAALGKHLLELLLLRVIQDRFDLAVRILHDGPHLGVAILLAERSIGAQGLHLLLASREDGRNLRHLVARQVQPLSQMRGKLLGREVAVLIARLLLRGLRRIGSGSLIGIRRLCEHYARGKQRAQNDSCFGWIHFSVSPFGCRVSDRPLGV